MDSLNNTTDINSTVSPLKMSGDIIIVDFRTWYKHGFEFFMFGYFMPFWVFVNVIIYSLMITVFLRNGMTSKTHICLIMIAVCDILSSVPPGCMWFFVFGIQRQFYFLPLSWCRLYHRTTEVIPRMFAFASRLLTILLAVQRYVIVAFPFKAAKCCSKKNIYCMIIFCLLFPIAFLFVYFFQYDFFSFTVPAFHDVNETLEACAVRGKGWFKMSSLEYIIMFDFLYTTTCHFIPALLLILFEILLLRAMEKNSEKRKRMLSVNQRQTKKSQREKRLTNTTIVITLIDLLYEIAQTTRDMLNCANWLGFISLTQGDLRSANVVLQIIYWVSMPSNFIIICTCSQDFRIALKSMFVKPSRNVASKSNEFVSNNTVSTSVSRKEITFQNAL